MNPAQDKIFKQKYMKYKQKYLILKEQYGASKSYNWIYFFLFEKDYTGSQYNGIELKQLEGKPITINEPEFDITSLSSLATFKPFVIYKAYELSTNNLSPCRFGLSYYHISHNKSNLYNNMFNNFNLTSTHYKNITPTNKKSVDNLNLDDIELINIINNMYIHNLVYKPEIQDREKKSIVRINKIVSFYRDTLSQIYEVKYEEGNENSRTIESINHMKIPPEVKTNKLSTILAPRYH